MSRQAEAKNPRIALDLCTPEARTRTEGYTIDVDLLGERIHLWFPEQVTSRIAETAVWRTVKAALACPKPPWIVVDLLSVERFSPSAPLAAICAGLPRVGRIAGVELIVRNRAIRVAATTAARVLGLACFVRDAR